MAKAKLKGAALTQAGPKITKDKSTVEAPQPENDYEVQGHLKTLMDAHEIMNNSDKMQKVHALAGRHKKAIRSIADLKQYAQDKYGKPMSALKDTESDGE